MAIIISKDGKGAKKFDRTSFENEEYLQKYIFNNPESIPLYDIKEGIKVLVVAKEFTVFTGSIDVLGIDVDGDIYIIETKLYKNPDKRQLIAQVLDYGASLWKEYSSPNNFIDKISLQINKEFKVGFIQKIKDFYKLDDVGAENLSENIKNNLSEGVFKFVVLMDTLPDALKNLIVFMNQNTKFDIYAVEMELYNYEDLEIMIPKLFGADVKKDLDAKQVRGKEWDENSFFEAVENKVLDNEVKNIMKELYEFTSKKSSLKPFITKTKVGTFNLCLDKKRGSWSIFHVTTDGKIRFFYMNKFTELRDKLRTIGFDISDNTFEKAYDLSIFKNEIDLTKFKEVVDDFVKKK